MRSGVTLMPAVQPPRFEAAGPREKIFFDPATLACGIVTCGGLCPGLNDVIRSIVLSLHHHYGVRTIYGFRYGYEGLAPKFGHQPIDAHPRSRGRRSTKWAAPSSAPPAATRMSRSWSIPWSA